MITGTGSLIERNMIRARIEMETFRLRFAIRIGRGPNTFNRIAKRHPEDAQVVADALSTSGGAR